MPTLEERARRFFGAPEIRRSADRAPVSGQRHSGVAHQPAGGGAARTLSGAECRRGGGYNYRDDDRVADQPGQFSIARESRHRQQRLAARDGDAISATARMPANVFGFVDSASTSNLDTAVTWSHRFSQFLTLRIGISSCGRRAIRRRTSPIVSTCRATPASPATTRSRSTGVRPRWFFRAASPASATGQYLRQESRTHGFSPEALWRTRGGHNFTFGGSLRPQTVDVLGQQDARGRSASTDRSPDPMSRTFSWASPHSAAIAFGNADKLLRGALGQRVPHRRLAHQPDAHRQSRCAMGIRSAVHRALGRLVNLDVAPGFTAATPVVGADARAGSRGVQPRLGIALRPVAGSSLVIRAG